MSARPQFQLAPAAVEDKAEARLRRDVRDFLDGHLAGFGGGKGAAPGFDAAFSREMGRRGWIGSSWPARYGGWDAGSRSRFIILEEMLAAGAPILAHMVGERQSGPLLLRYGTERQRETYLPRIAAGECYFCIGMSEPQAGSDLAAIRTRAERVDGGFRINGTKIWTTLAHLADYIIILCRTAPPSADRHAGMSQIIVDLRSPGVTITPIISMAGEHEFNQVFFDDVLVSEDALIGTQDHGWSQALSELTSERGGPDRYFASFAALRQVIDALGPHPSESAATAIGRLVAHFLALRRLGRSVVDKQALGEDPAADAALLKEIGASFEQDVTEALRQILPPGGDGKAPLAELMLRYPSHAIRAGSREILRGVIARGMIGAI